jgi:hypothetical protein
MEKRKTICFAYFGDDKFLGWYADSFGSIRKDSPKIYGDSKEQIAIITGNFRYKIEKMLKNNDIKLGDNDVASNLLNSSLNKDGSKLSSYSNIELRIVECPIYDGPNPDFNKEEYKKLSDEYQEKLEELTKHLFPGPSSERSAFVAGYKINNPSPRCNNWIYADYNEVNKWALEEPTEFIGVIKTENEIV